PRRRERYRAPRRARVRRGRHARRHRVARREGAPGELVRGRGRLRVAARHRRAAARHRLARDPARGGSATDLGVRHLHGWTLPGKYCDPSRILMFIARHDTTVPTRNQKQLRDALGGPRAFDMPTSHYTTMAYTPFVRAQSTTWLLERMKEPNPRVPEPAH